MELNLIIDILTELDTFQKTQPSTQTSLEDFRLYLNEKAVNHSNLRMLVFFLYYAIAIFLTSNSIEWLTEKNNINHNISWLMCTIIASFFNFIFVSKIALHLKQYS